MIIMMMRVHGRLLKPPTLQQLGWPWQTRAFSNSCPVQNVSNPAPRMALIATLLREASLLESQSSVVQSQNAPDIVTVNGWVRSNRNMKNYSFLHLADGTTTQPLQAVIPKDQFVDTKALTTGTCIQITGEWKFSPGAKKQQQVKELHYHSLRILGPADPEVRFFPQQMAYLKESWNAYDVMEGYKGQRLQLTTYPLQKKYHTPEFLRSMPHLRPRISTQAALLQLRSWTASRISNFFVEREFVQVHPPIITSSDCEGAGEVFTVSVSSEESEEPNVAGVLGSAPPSSAPSASHKVADHFFRTPKYLTVSSQLHLECFAHAVPKVWTLSPTFRAEKSDTNRHLSEFYMLEAEVAFTESLEDVMSVVEDMTRYVVSGLVESRVGKEIADIYTNRSAEEASGEDEDTTREGLQARWESLLATNRWTRMTYTQAIEHLSNAVNQSEATFVFEPVWGHALQAEHEKFLARKFGGDGDGSGGPVFVTDYPRALKPFYMLPSSLEGTPDTVACFDLLVPHVGELVGGSLREHRYDNLVNKMREFGLIPPNPPPPSASPAEAQEGVQEEDLSTLKWYAELRKWGSVEHGGFGMGFDRLLAYLAGIKDIREVVPFPRWSGRCDC